MWTFFQHKSNIQRLLSLNQSKWCTLSLQFPDSRIVLLKIQEILKSYFLRFDRSWKRRSELYEFAFTKCSYRGKKRIIIIVQAIEMLSLSIQLFAIFLGHSMSSKNAEIYYWRISSICVGFFSPKLCLDNSKFLHWTSKICLAIQIEKGTIITVEAY